MRIDSLPTEEQLKADYIVWFREQYGVPPVITSSTGVPAVHFALHALRRYVLLPLLNADEGEA